MTKEQLLKKRELLLKKKQLLEQKAAASAQADTTEEVAPREKHSVGRTAAEHFVEGATLGHTDTVAGLVNKGLSKLAGANSPYEIDRKLKEQGFTGDLEDNPYQEAVNDRRQLLAETREDNPKTAFAADLVGGAGTTMAAAAATGGGSLLVEGGIAGVGYGDSDDLRGTVQDAVVGATLGKYGGKVLNSVGRGAAKAVKSVAPSTTKAIYNALSVGSRASKPSIVKNAINKLESKYNVFTGNGKLNVTPELAEQKLNELSSKLNGELAEMNTTIANSGKQDELLDSFSDIPAKLRSILSDDPTLRPNSKGQVLNPEVSGVIDNLATSLDDALVDGDYGGVVNLINSELKDLVRFKYGKIQAKNKAANSIVGVLKQFDDTNKKFIKEVAGDDGFKVFSETMEDLKAYHEVKDFIGKNIGKEAKVNPTMKEFIASGVIQYMTNPLIGAAYMGGSMILRQPAVQSFMAQSYKQVNRSFEGAKSLLASPVAAVLKENLPEEVMHLVNKVEAGVVIPTVQQHLVVKSLTSQFPEFFEHSEYESLIDGKITDPYEVDLEKKRVMDDKSVSNVDKYKQINSLNKDGTLLRSANTAKGTVMPVAPHEKAQIGSFLDMGSQIMRGEQGE